MAEPKPFASLSAGLLARKGQARPAMRPQPLDASGAPDDLGWNDMGFAPSARPVMLTPSPVATPVQSSPPPPLAPVTPVLVEPIPVEGAPALCEIVPAAPPVSTPADESPVLRQQAAIAAELGAVREQVIASVLPVARAKAGAKSKAAFTLRLDPERHLKLRLACALGHRSAQALVTEALDTFLGGLPEIEAAVGAAAKR